MEVGGWMFQRVDGVGRSSERPLCHRYHVYPSVAHGMHGMGDPSSTLSQSGITEMQVMSSLDRSAHRVDGFRPVWRTIQGK